MNLDDLFPDNVSFIEEAYEDFLKLDGSIVPMVLKGIKKVAANPGPDYAGGYGKPLGNKNGNNLSGLMKIKFKSIGVRCVYKCMPVNEKDGMKIIVISIRASEKVYKEAFKRRSQHNM